MYEGLGVVFLGVVYRVESPLMYVHDVGNLLIFRNENDGECFIIVERLIKCL